ncbi:GTP-binding protein YPTM1 [Biomphalaria pfeifferi]|uniref:GTP-binding protein YPTM1 n=1 Tax=Biomphalaria pfeifferi TaxID=112525 RepID=A0AAD8EY25_BIOPF|nr:GTP-binding protein YPTM1 [Biomphalaria pfeifferi]
MISFHFIHRIVTYFIVEDCNAWKNAEASIYLGPYEAKSNACFAISRTDGRHCHLTNEGLIAIVLFDTRKNQQARENIFKIIFVGDSSVGKTSLMLRYTDDCFSDTFITTIGVDFRNKPTEVSGIKVKLQIWDTAPPYRFRRKVPSFYRGADGVMFVFDLTNMDSFHNMSSWMKETAHDLSEHCKLLLVGKKSDQVEERVVTFEAAQSFADSVGLPYLETSAKSSFNVHNAFNSLAQSIVKNKRNMLKQATAADYVDIRARPVDYDQCYGRDICSTA